MKLYFVSVTYLVLASLETQTTSLPYFKKFFNFPFLFQTAEYLYIFTSQYAQVH